MDKAGLETCPGTSLQVGDRVFLALQVVLVDEKALVLGWPRILSKSWL